MPAWVTEWLPAAPWVAVILGAAFLTIKAWPVVVKTARFLDDVMGEPERPGVPARPGLMERVQAIEHEVKPNTGTSLRDAADRTEKAVDELREGMDDVHRKLDHDNRRITDLTESLDKHVTESTRIISNLSKEKQ